MRIITPKDPKFLVKLKFEPRDLWVGVYWDFERYIWNPDQTEHWWLDVYVCLIPTLPLRLGWRR